MIHLKTAMSGLLKTNLYCSFQNTVGGFTVKSKTTDWDSIDWGRIWATPMNSASKLRKPSEAHSLYQMNIGINFLPKALLRGLARRCVWKHLAPGRCLLNVGFFPHRNRTCIFIDAWKQERNGMNKDFWGYSWPSAGTRRCTQVSAFRRRPGPDIKHQSKRAMGSFFSGNTN